ncbi:hypothetical protein GCM10007384_16110 [Aquimarina muelleri]|uniref:Uncharacterized protein n=1 Tax=Aquimarina muelleri TaxID=279356 RepID=A0A918JU58_9FLAO|nr:hypothetical protein GCM10007384_16110 [Aquimarina muelleri]
MIDVSKIVRGNTIGINLGVANVKNFIITEKSRSFPASSDINNQIVCNNRINIIIIKSGKNVFIKVVKIYLSRIFTRFVFSNSQKYK